MINQYFFNLLFSIANKNKLSKFIVIALIKLTYYFFIISYISALIFLLFNINYFGYGFFIKFLVVPFFAILTSRLLRTFINSKRPFEKMNITPLIYHKGGNSFPSNHATSSMVIALSISFLFPAFSPVFIFSSLITSILRVMAGLHYPIDILFGLFLGFLFAFLGFFILK